jgi:putative component of membrane protein insertase Oxa1/YidC/SpoIIIJ protein YidD
LCPWVICRRSEPWFWCTAEWSPRACFKSFNKQNIVISCSLLLVFFAFPIIADIAEKSCWHYPKCSGFTSSAIPTTASMENTWKLCREADPLSPGVSGGWLDIRWHISYIVQSKSRLWFSWFGTMQMKSATRKWGLQGVHIWFPIPEQWSYLTVTICWNNIEEYWGEEIRDS